MSYARVLERLRGGERLVLDGATGTELQRRGVSMDPNAWCGAATLGNDAILAEIHADYIRAGSDVITANTFASSRLMLAGSGHAERTAEINRRAVEAALAGRERAATGRDVLVAASLSHMVPMTEGTAGADPSLLPSPRQMADAFAELAGIVTEAGADLILLEMMYHPERAPLALEAALATGLPVWFGLSARRLDDGRLGCFDPFRDVALGEVARLAATPGIDVAGAMHTGAELIEESLAELRRHFDGPLMAYPDSGYFEMPEWNFVDVIPPARFEEFATGWYASGVQLIGGCCGLTVAHVEAAARARNRAA